MQVTPVVVKKCQRLHLLLKAEVVFFVFPVQVLWESFFTFKQGITGNKFNMILFKEEHFEIAYCGKCHLCLPLPLLLSIRSAFM